METKWMNLALKIMARQYILVEDIYIEKGTAYFRENKIYTSPIDCYYIEKEIKYLKKLNPLLEELM